MKACLLSISCPMDFPFFSPGVSHLRQKFCSRYCHLIQHVHSTVTTLHTRRCSTPRTLRKRLRCIITGAAVALSCDAFDHSKVLSRRSQLRVEHFLVEWSEYIFVTKREGKRRHFLRWTCGRQI